MDIHNCSISILLYSTLVTHAMIHTSAMDVYTSYLQVIHVVVLRRGNAFAVMHF